LKKLDNMYYNLNINEFKCTFYGITNCWLSNFIITAHGKEIYIYIYIYIYICLKCYIEHDAPTYVKYDVFQSSIYMKALLSKHPYYIQLLSFLNIGIYIYIIWVSTLVNNKFKFIKYSFIELGWYFR
jgi:hypothetical protein